MRSTLSLIALSAGLTAPAAAQPAADAMWWEHAHELPVPSAAVASPPAQEAVAREVEYGTVEGRPAHGYYARPARAPDDEALPAVLVIHEWWGLNDNIRAMARRLAGEGYQVLALDMYGRVAETPAQAREFSAAIRANPGRGEEHLRAGTTYLAERQGAPRVGVLGWCFGGGWALQAALVLPARVHAAVMYYGTPVTEPPRLAALRAPLLGHFGGADQGIPLAEVREMERVLREQGKEVTAHVYQGAGHAFANPSGERYRPEAADEAWRRTTAFLAEHLRPG